MSTLQHVFSKTAADESKDKEKESPYDLGWRHLQYPARIAALQGLPIDTQVEANWSRIKELPVAVPAYAAAAALNLVAPGAGTGAVTGVGPLIHAGTKSIFDTKADMTTPLHIVGPARYLSYAGGSLKQQDQALWDHLKLLGSTLLGGGLGGALGYFTADKMQQDRNIGAVIGAILGAAGGHTGSFLYMLNNRKNKN